MKNKFFTLFLFVVLSINNSFSQIIITPVTNLQNAIQNSLLGAGVVVNNITYNGVPNSLAEITGASSIGISNGLYIGTGTSLTLDSVASFLMSDGAASIGDVDLQAIASGSTQDAGVLEFDFKVQGDSVKFNFVFASEEYSDYVGSGFNDVFGFFISGPGITGKQNMAIIPGTTLPVAINNVNNGNSMTGVVPTGPCTNCIFYNDNTNGTTCVFDGMTTVLTATYAVQPCTFYHIKLAIANVGDGALDSGILLEANSFTPCGPLSVFKGLSPVEDTLSLCTGNSITLTSCLAPNYLWNTGDTTQSITVTQPGNYSMTVNVGTCFASSSQITVVSDTGFAKPQVLQNGSVLSSSIINSSYIYKWYKNGNALNNSNNPNLQVNTGGCYKVMITDSAGCSSISDSLCLTFAGIPDNESMPFSFSVYPNPSHGRIHISYFNDSHDLFQLRMTDLSGKALIKTNSTGNSILLMPQQLQPGIYFIELENLQSKEKARSKIVVE